MNKIWAYIKKEPITVFFLLIVLSSFIWQFSFRNEHFQECDSAGTYYSIYEFPKSAVYFAGLTYQPGHIITPALANKILHLGFTQKIVHNYFPWYNQNQIINKLTTLNVFAAARFGLTEVVSALHLPHPLLSMFALPMSSTYFPGSGLFYGLISTSHSSYASFVSWTLGLNLLIFSLAAIALYFIGHALKFSAAASAIAALLFLFSITHYSYAFSMGSVVWMFSSEIFWLWFVVKNWDHPRRLERISWASGILIFFNYLIALFWLAFLVTAFFQENPVIAKNFKGMARQVWDIIKTQIAAIILIAIIAIVFYPPGQGLRGDITWHTFGSDIYYIVLNFFAFFNTRPWLNIAQFILGAALTLGGLVWIFSFHPFKRADNAVTAAKKILQAVVIIYALLACLKILGFAPDRHILFFSPIIFIGSAAVLNYVIKKDVIAWIIMLAICVIGFVGIGTRHNEVKDVSANIPVDSRVSEVGIYDCSYNLAYRNWPTQAPVTFINPKQFLPGKIYLYVSQTTPFAEADAQWQNSYNLSLQSLNQYSKITNYYFNAFNPDFSRFGFTRPNNLYVAEFKVNSVQPK